MSNSCKLKKNRKIVKSLMKSVKQLAKDKWNETKRQVKTELNEMVNSVPNVINSIKEELISMVKAEIQAIIDTIEPSLQEIAYACNKGYRIYVQYKNATSEEAKEQKKKEIVEWLKAQPKQFVNGFILLVIKDALEEALSTFSQLWNAGYELWQETADAFQKIKDVFTFNDEKLEQMKSAQVKRVLALINQMLPLILSLTVLIQNYIINHGLLKETSNNQVGALQGINAMNKGVQLRPKDTSINQDPTVSEVYKDSTNPDDYKVTIGDCKLYPQEYVDPYDSSLCYVEPSQLLRVIKKDQERMKSKDFQNGSSYSDSKYAQNTEGQENSLCYLIPPSRKNLNDILNGDDSDKDANANCLHAIIEFDDECCKYPAEPYKWECQPGDVVYQDKVLATCQQYEKMVPVKSIFSKGVIRKDPCTGDFARIRKDVCDRHIIIDCYESGVQGVVDSSIVEDLNNDFKKENCIYRLLYEYMVYSVLPNIIARKTYYVEPSYMLGLFINPSWVDNNNHPDAYDDVYKDFIEHYEDTVNNFNYEIQELDSEKRIKATEGDYYKLKALSDEILNLRKDFMWGKHNWSKARNGIIDLYNMRDSRPLTKCYDNYSDARYLGETYYADLIAMLQFTEEEECIFDYYRVLENIIYRREQIEGYSWETIKEKVNKNLREIGSSLRYEELDRAFRKIANTDKFSAVQEIITSDMTISDYSLYKKVYAATNLFLLLKRREKNKNPYRNRYSTEYYYQYSNVEILDLVKKERQELEDFFKEKMALYNKVDITSLIKRTENLSEIQAEWPPSIDIVVDGTTYKLFKFSNIDAYLKSLKKGSDNSIDAGINPDNYVYNEPNEADLKKRIDGILNGGGVNAEDALNSPDLIPDTTDDKFSGLTDIPITDIRYWLKYCGLATLASIPFLATGLVILGIPIPLPGIYTPFTVVKGDVLMVIGLGIRGITFFPMIIYVNAGQDNSTALVPILMVLKAVRDQFENQISKIENTIPNVADLMIAQLETNNANLLNQNKQIETQIANLKAQQKPEWSEIKKQMKTVIKADTRQIITRIKSK